MKKIVSISKTIIIVLCLFCTDLVSAQVTPDSAYMITDADKKWLVYYDIANQFDSATVSFQYGELLIRNSTTKQRIHPVTTLTHYTWVQNDGANGVQTDIQALMKWDTVTIPNSSEVRFFRKASVKTCCPSQNDHQHSNGAVATWSVPDSLTECILEARDATNDTVVFVADSIGIRTCNSITYTDFYGHDSIATYHATTIPSHAWGKKVYFTVKPRRYGNSAYGMSCVTTQYPLAWSMVDHGKLGFASKSIYDSLMNVRFTLFMKYAQAAWDAYCWIPAHNQFPFSQAEHDTILSHFYTDTIVNGNTVWKMKPCTGDSCGNVYAKGGGFKSNTESNTARYSNEFDVVRTSINGTQILVDVNLTGRPRQIRVTAFLVTGQEVGWKNWTLLQTGNTTLDIEVGNIASPVVLLSIADEHGNALAFTKVKTK